MFAQEYFRLDGGGTKPRSKCEVLVVRPRQHGARAKGCGRHTGAVALCFVEDLVSHAERSVHQTGGGLNGPLFAMRIGEVAPPGRRSANVQIQGPSLGQPILKRDIALVDVDAVALAPRSPG